jgi:hypothetical protein
MLPSNSPDLAILFTLPSTHICASKIANHHPKFLTMKLTILNIYCALLVIAGLSASCKKNISADLQESGAEALSGIEPVPSYTWSELAIPGDGVSYPSQYPRMGVFTVPVGDTYYCWTGRSMELVYVLNKTTKRWQPHPGFESANDLFATNKLLFVHDSNLYYGLADRDPGYFGVLDPVGGQRTNLARFPGADSVGPPQTFVVGDNGYLFFDGGYGKFWRYNFPTDTWTMMGESPLGKRYGSTIVVVGDKVYAGLGWELTTFGGQTFRNYKRDWKVFTVGSSWAAAKAEFPGDLRSLTENFVIGDNIYVGFGSHYSSNNNPSTTRYRDLWKYNINSNSWGRVADYPGIMEPGLNQYFGSLSAFALGNSAYVVTGGLNEFWRFANTPLITTQQ